jgi:chromosome segregation ATPase
MPDWRSKACFSAPRREASGLRARTLTFFPGRAYGDDKSDAYVRFSRAQNRQFMNKLESAMERITGALDRLEASINRQGLRSQSAATLQNEINILKEDRARLAEELDALKSEARSLNELNDRASETIANAIDSIRDVLAAN